MSRGGRRPGAGRKKSYVAQRTREIANRAAAQGITPLEYMLEVMRTSPDEKMRAAMAIAAAPYVHPRLSAVEHSGEMTQHIVTDQPALSADEWQNAYADAGDATTH